MDLGRKSEAASGHSWTEDFVSELREVIDSPRHPPLDGEAPANGGRVEKLPASDSGDRAGPPSAGRGRTPTTRILLYVSLIEEATGGREKLGANFVFDMKRIFRTGFKVDLGDRDLRLVLELLGYEVEADREGKVLGATKLRREESDDPRSEFVVPPPRWLLDQGWEPRGAPDSGPCLSQRGGDGQAVEPGPRPRLIERHPSFLEREIQGREKLDRDFLDYLRSVLRVRRREEPEDEDLRLALEFLGFEVVIANGVLDRATRQAPRDAGRTATGTAGLSDAERRGLVERIVKKSMGYRKIEPRLSPNGTWESTRKEEKR